MGNGVSVEYSSVTDALLAGKTQQEIEVYLAQVQNYQPQQIGDLLEGTNQNDLSDSNLHPWHSIMSLSPTIQLQKLRAGVHTENILKLDKLNLKKLDDIDINVEVSKLIDLRFKAEPSLTGLCLQSFDGLEKFVLSMQLSRQLLFLDLSDNDDLSYVSFSQIVSKLNNSNHSITNKLNKNSSSRTDINNHDTDDDSADCRDNQEVIVLDADAAAETTQMKLERQSPAADVENFKSENLNPSSQDLENLITVDGAWLLELSLAGLQAQALPYGVSEWKPLCHLLIMDLSFINDLDITRINWKALQVLIKLSMEDCDLNTLNLDNFRIHSLLCLNVAENRFNSTDDLLPVKMMPYLQELDTRNNEISSGGTTATREVYRATVTAWVGSSLKLLDNKILGKDMSTKALADVEGLALLVNATDTILDDAEGSERCSCLEGNACVDPYTCKDWKNRERISAQVRRNKHYEFGLNNPVARVGKNH